MIRHQTTADFAEMEVLSFRLGGEEYGVNILSVQEIRGYDAVTRVANAPDFVKGVINLRGIIVPIIDMRIKFGMPSPVYGDFTVVIIINTGGRVIGMVVDSVSDVSTLEPAQIKPAPDIRAGTVTEHIVGIGTVDDRMMILIDIDRFMASDDMGLIEKIAA